MATIAEQQLMKVSNFSDGTDSYRGIKGISYRKNARPTYPVILEGQLDPSRLEEVENNTPAWSGQLQMSGPVAQTLVGTTIEVATVTVRDVTTASGTLDIEITNMLIKDINQGVDNRGVQGATHAFEATLVELVSGS